MIYVLSALLAIVGVTVVATVIGYVRLKSAEADEYRKAADGFFAAAKPLVRDDETPTEMLQIINYMNDAITDRRESRKMLSYIINERWDAEQIASSRTKMIVEFFERRPELKDSRNAMFDHWFAAITRLSPALGMLARATMSKGNVGRAVTYRASKSDRYGGTSCSHGFTGVGV